jgi:Mycothiol maleylpyruvate isomerase N-terminal domain
MDDTGRDSFLAAAQIAADLVRRPEVTERWKDESACAAMSVGGLACHLGSQVTNTVTLLSAPASDDAPIPVLEHYVRAAWVHTDLDAEVNVGIREGSDAEAVAGPDALATRVEEQLRLLPDLLAGSESRDSVFIPWQGWSLTVDDWLVTRKMEIVVHSDDLAASVGVPTPEFPESVVHPVLALLAAVAARRHGQHAVVRALSRPQRATSSVSAF